MKEERQGGVLDLFGQEGRGQESGQTDSSFVERSGTSPERPRGEARSCGD